MTGIDWYMFHSVPNHYGSSAKLSSSPILGQIVRLRTVSLVSLNGSKHGFRQDEHKPPDFAAATSSSREKLAANQESPKNTCNTQCDLRQLSLCRRTMHVPCTGMEHG
eukprot:scpid73872/ scgid27196/ 